MLVGDLLFGWKSEFSDLHARIFGCLAKLLTETAETFEWIGILATESETVQKLRVKLLSPLESRGC